MKISVEIRTLGLLRQRHADQADVLVDGGVLHDAKTVAQLDADFLANLPLFRVGNIPAVVEGLLRRLRLPEGAAISTKLGNAGVAVASSAITSMVRFISSAPFRPWARDLAPERFPRGLRLRKSPPVVSSLNNDVTQSA